MLRAKQVAFQYPQKGRGLFPTSLEIVPGEPTLVTGPSGCGKSTLARCLVGLIPHLYHGELSGEVWLNGYRTTEVPMWQLAQKAGMLLQNPASQMLAPSVEDEIIFGLENLGLSQDEIRSRLEEVLRSFGLAPLRDRNPHALSGGEQQKLALAAVVARQPDALVLDEPLSMLDTSAAEELIGYLEGLSNIGKSILVFEHRQEYLAEVANLRLITLDGKSGGRVLSQGGMDILPKKNFSLEIGELSVNLGGRTVLQNLSLSLPGGKIVAVVGRNGVGKTTLLRALSGLQNYRGKVWISSPDGDQQPDLGIVFQNPDLQLFNASVRDEILYRCTNPDMTYYQSLLSVLGLEPYENTPPLLLSEGEKKRVALGLVLMRKPTHGLLLDEPSLGQDVAHKEILMRVLRSLADSGQLVIMTTHDLTLASQADRLILLGMEGVVADGETEAVLQDTIAWQQAGIIQPNWFLRSRAQRSVS